MIEKEAANMSAKLHAIFPMEDLLKGFPVIHPTPIDAESAQIKLACFGNIVRK